jgi:hypothetical protein
MEGKSMKRALIVGALAAACLPQTANPASALSDAARLQTLIRLERQAAPRAVPNAPSFIRNASISVAGRVQIVSPTIAGPLFCLVRFFYSDPNTGQFHAESATSRIAVTGHTGTCSITVPFRWQNVSDSLENVRMFLEVGNAIGSFADAAVAQPLRASQFDGPSLPLALEGEDIHVTFDIRI